MIIHDYESASGRKLVLEYILDLPQNERIDGLSVLEALEKGDFDSIYTQVWEGRVREVYFRKHKRIFYVIADENNLYLLHACKKQKN